MTYDIEYFKRRSVTRPNGCWEWSKASTCNGYGVVTVSLGSGRNRKVRAHRMAYCVANQVILPTTLCVCHRCDNPACVNPDHLFHGSHLDNMRDRTAKGRAARQKGEDHGRSKLTESDVANIKTMYRNGLLQREIASMYGVRQQAISMIVTGRNWAHLK